MSPHLRKTLVVVGHGMVGHRFVQAAIERGLTETHDVVVIGEEPRAAYDRVALTSFFEVGAEELSLLPGGEYDDPRVRLRLATTVRGLDPATRTVELEDGEVLVYDELVLATGAAPFVPPVPGTDLDGCFVYRTIEDLEAIREAAAGATVGAVVGGGLLGLEAANALAQLGLETHVVEMAPRLMAVQVDDAGGATLVAADVASLAAGLLTRDGGASRSRAAAARAFELARRCEGATTPALDRVTLGPLLTPREREIVRLAASGLTLSGTAGGSTIRGLVIRDFNGHGISILDGADFNIIAGNYIGRLTVAGTDAGAGEENTSVPSATTSNTPLAPFTSAGSTPTACLISAARLTARGR